MKKQFVEYQNPDEKYSLIHQNKNLGFLLDCVAFKYGIVHYGILDGKKMKLPKRRQAKHFICQMCDEYFGIRISLKQIRSLLRPQSKKFPYTAIVIIETVYNLMKEGRWDDSWVADLIEYLQKTHSSGIKYEEFLLKDLLEKLIKNVDILIGTSYEDIFVCLADSRKAYQQKFKDISMIEHCSGNFPSGFFNREDIPRTMYEYNGVRIYFDEEESDGTSYKEHK